jgi:hypothetical protein
MRMHEARLSSGMLLEKLSKRREDLDIVVGNRSGHADEALS